MKLAIVGSRTFNDYELLCGVIDEVKDIELIISGGANGADSLAEKYAKDHSIPTKIYHADWNKYGKRAGYIRNVDIITNCDCVIAFWDCKSKGTKHSIDLANTQKKKLLIINTLLRRSKPYEN
jgi:hypothetical protein